MKISQLSFEQNNPKLIINDVKFDSFNVLVGISGAGKTTIISAIKNLVQLVNGYQKHSIKWKLNFSDNLQSKIVWSGEISEPSTTNDDGSESGSFIAEALHVDGVQVFSRSNDSIIYKGIVLPKLDSLTSLIYQFREDEGINYIHESLSSITIVDVDSNDFSRPNTVRLINKKLHDAVTDSKLSSIKEISKKHKTLKCREKIYYAFKYDQKAFEDYIFAYTSIFPSVHTIEPRLIVAMTDDGKEEKNLIFIDLHMQSGEVVNQRSISSGMFKTMMILSELYLGNNDTPIVIDEIENSLGVNCLSDVLSEMEAAENQIIVTSHHPLVINKIPAKYWSVVTRSGQEIKTTKAELVIGSVSNHDKFIQLINSKLYRGD